MWGEFNSAQQNRKMYKAWWISQGSSTVINSHSCHYYADHTVTLTCIVIVFAFVASESDLQNKRLKLDYEEITPCLKEVTLVWEKMLGTPGRAKVKFDTETIHAAVAQGTYLSPEIHISVLLWKCLFFF